VLYIRIAKKFNIVDRPNHRSSHSIVTVRGGGIIFPVAVLIWWALSGATHTLMVIGLVLISSISMLDDIKTLSRKLRFGIQFIALTLAFIDLGLFEQQSLWVIPILYFFALGIINAINFMDGINGITGLYFLVFFGTILAINQYLPIFQIGLIENIILSIFVFLFFNLRKKALMFAGDIGSISMAYLVIYFLTQWYLHSGSWTIILLLLVYGADAFLTLVQRIIKGENITEAHRSHLYQLIVNQLKVQHILVALIFAILQLIFNFVFFLYPKDVPSYPVAWIILFVTALLYLGIKFLVQKRTSLSN
jgi:UDP-N-acetylmuramyl pentapeptide phosphotransferase/UDP-N-acetylglucosamine-1-phosphate transferase